MPDKGKKAAERHKQNVQRIAGQLKERKSTAQVSLKKKSVSHQVPKLSMTRELEKIDISDLDEIISIDKEKRICIAEPGVTFVDLVNETLKYGLVPFVVPELKTITIGGAVAGCSIESMSYKCGGFHDSCLEYEIVTGRGEIMRCSPGKNELIFQMMHGTFGTLGIITRLKFKLTPAKPYVRIEYEKYDNLEDYKSAIWDHYKKKDVDFMDGIIHSPTEYVLSAGNFVSHAPYTHKYDWMRIYYLSTAKRKEDYLKTIDYFFRYDKGVTKVRPMSFIGRLFLGKFLTSTVTLKIAKILGKWLPEDKIPLTVDTFIPFSKIDEFMKWYEKEMKHFPLWCVPYKVPRQYEWASDEFWKGTKDKLFLDIAIYGMRRKDKMKYYKILEDKLMELGAIKTLISVNLYTKEDFWKVWNKDNYYKVKKITDPENIFRDLYTKTCSNAAQDKK